MHCLISTSHGVPVLKPTAPNKRLYLMGGEESIELEQRIKECLDPADEAAKQLPLIIDLTHVIHLNSNGLGILLTTVAQYNRRRRKVALVIKLQTIQNVFTATKLALAFDSFETLEAATNHVLGREAKT